MRIKAIMIRILQQLAHDKRTIGLMIMAPILVLLLMSFIFNGTSYKPKIGIINAPQILFNKLETNNVQVTRFDENTSYGILENNLVDGILNYENGIPKIKLEGSDPNKNTGVIMAVQNALIQSNMAQKLDITYLYGYKDMAMFDNFGPILIGFFVFFFVFLISGVSFLSERNTGTLERILATPVRRWEIVVGYILGFGIFTFIQSTIIAWFAIYILKVMMVGSFTLVLIITFLTAMVGLTIGTFISAYADNELQMIQFVPIIVVPQIFFSGLFDLSTMPVWLQSFGQAMPLWYVAHALKNIMIRGKGLMDISFDILVLLGTCILFMVANTLALKKHRKL